jgi:hypothetical protein
LAVGRPMKAVSFHGEIVHLQDSSLQREMVVDVCIIIANSASLEDVEMEKPLEQDGNEPFILPRN